MEKGYEKASLTHLPATRCPCGWARRAFGELPEKTATIHLVDIESDSRVHYHKSHTEIYLILEGEGHMELDGERVPVEPMDVIYIRPGCRHRAVGRMKVVNVPVPAFDAADEWFD